MSYYADLHMHSRFSRATSKHLTLPVLEEYARKKGITVMGTGDFTHPLWLWELEQQLEPVEAGLYKLKDSPDSTVRFMLSVEIASIYSQAGQSRRIHTLIMLPSLAAAKRFNQSLQDLGAKLSSDGRPIVGLSVKKIAKLALDADPSAIIIPAHIWTPWFGLFGSMSGFDSLEECFEELTPEILAIETGLSSDPPMNWRLSQLDKVALVSFSDAHSQTKIAREATIFDGELSYPTIREALKYGAPAREGQNTNLKTQLVGTVEFFPEEGKYHYDGHREHHIRWTPEQTAEHKGICSVCGRRVTVGVLSRVQELADRPEGYKPAKPAAFKSLVPLAEIIAEVFGVSAASKKVEAVYNQLINELGSELTILINTSLTDIESATDANVAQAIKRVRAGKLQIEPGYDGEFGTIHVFTDEERQSLGRSAQPSLF